MKLTHLIEFLRHRIKVVVRICLVGLALLVLLDASPAVVNKEHAHTWAEHIPGFWALFGFVGCILLFVFSKMFGHFGVTTREDYYDE
ncbi:MAG: hypothetical protein WA117_23455 [Verrucomicrobiia bacterium]